MRRTTVAAMGLLCLIALKPSSLVAQEKSVESAKADSGLRFLESGKGQSGVGEPSAVRAEAAPSRASGLTAAIASQRASGALQVSVPAPAAAAQNDASAASSSWSKWKIGGALVGGAVAAFIAIPLTFTWMPTPVAAVITGILITEGAAIGYGIGALAERAAEKIRRAVSSGALDQ